MCTLKEDTGSDWSLEKAGEVYAKHCQWPADKFVTCTVPLPRLTGQHRVYFSTGKGIGIG